jgi:hypothetical protein
MAPARERQGPTMNMTTKLRRLGQTAKTTDSLKEDIHYVREKSVDIEKSKESQWENKPNTSALLTTLLEFLKKKEPELYSSALRRLEAHRGCPRHP